MSTLPTPVRKPPSAASRYLVLFVIGLVVGLVAAVMLMRAIDARRDKYPSSVMHVLQAQLGGLRANVEGNRCAATDTLPRLQALRVLSNDFEPAFKGLADDTRFRGHASHMRATLDKALASPPLNCAGVEAVVASIADSCKACHQDFR